jgi:hypothetical protein
MAAIASSAPDNRCLDGQHRQAQLRPGQRRYLAGVPSPELSYRDPIAFYFVSRDPIAFYFVFKDLIAFDFVNKDLIALYFYLE